MRGSYPVAATGENWLHESLVEIIRIVHNKIDLAENIPSWENIIPLFISEENSDRLKSLWGIKDRVKGYELAVMPLTLMQRQAIFSELVNQNDVIGLLAGTGPLSNLKASFPQVHSVVHDLFIFAFGSLTGLGVRDRQYRIIFNALKVNVCIFCGIERVMSPQETRQDQDHYLAKSIYPFAAVNMRNLVPMCLHCNRNYKHDVDILLDGNGQRRKAFDPYNAPITDLTLIRSIPFGGTGLKFPAWWIDFLPDTEEAETWDQVFCIRMRYSRDVLNAGFNRWIQSFMDRCKLKMYSGDLKNADVLDILIEHHNNTLLENAVGLDYLKPKVFEMLIHHFRLGNDRVISFVRDIVGGTAINP